MLLCLDVGNSQIYGGLFEREELKFQFRKNSTSSFSSDECGLFLRGVLRENSFESEKISQISMCSVVPEKTYSIKKACENYFDLSPFILEPGVKTGLKIRYQNPLEVGSDRIANAIAATELFPKQNLIIVDFGTAITLCAVNSKKEYLGGVILPGLSIAMKALESHTAKLPSVEIRIPGSVLGRSTVESIQSGLYYGTKGSLLFIVQELKSSLFSSSPVKVLSTGGFAKLFSDFPLFDHEVQDLVLKGLFIAFKKNQEGGK